MAEQRIVALYGDSLLMDAVEASLEDNQELGVIRIHTTVSNVVECLRSLNPSLIILDMNDPHSRLMVSFLRDLPTVPLLCVDVTSSKVIALACQEYTVLTADDLAQVIHLQISGEDTEIERTAANAQTLWEEVQALVGV
jgi:hypothetical protein